MVACERPRWIALTHRRQAHLGRLIALKCVRKYVCKKIIPHHDGQGM